MAGLACLVPRQSVALYDLCQSGDWTAAMDLQRHLWSLNQAFAKYNLAACIKGGLEIIGYDVGKPLPPQMPLSAAGREELEKALRAVGRNRPTRVLTKRKLSRHQAHLQVKSTIYACCETLGNWV